MSAATEARKQARRTADQERRKQQREQRRADAKRRGNYKYAEGGDPDFLVQSR